VLHGLLHGLNVAILTAPGERIVVVAVAIRAYL
jgi:hypothetical protein